MLLYGEIGDTHVFYDQGTGKSLLIENGSITNCPELPTIYKQVNLTPIGCIIGIIKLKIGSHLVICDKYEVEGEIQGVSVAKVIGYRILPISSSARESSEESEYLKLLKEHLDKNEFYFSLSSGLDLTTNFQTQFTSKSSGSEFWWNKYLCDTMAKEHNIDSSFITPIINGYFKAKTVSFGGNDSAKFTYVLLTRKSLLRVGTRYFRRGIDENGNVANFNETEQIIITQDNQLMSFLQIRGSVPIYWSEINNLRYKPQLVVSTKNALDATVKHFDKSVKNYGEVYCINLVNNKGYELPVKSGFESIVNSLPQSLKSLVHYIYFDFHHECKNMKFENVNKLINTIGELGFSDENYFHIDLNSYKVFNLQKKVIRTNCMDCLDRTNVVQSMFSRWILQRNLSTLGYLNYAIPWKQVDPNFNFIFQNFWAENADSVSRSYSSTPALKTDFTRLGKRTFKGSLNDLNNSIVRYYNNNYNDGKRQDSFDLFLGYFKPYESVSNPFTDHRPLYIQLLPYVLTTSVLILLSLIFYPKGSLFSFKNLLTIGLCLLFQYKSVNFLLTNSFQFVNWPNLVNLDFLSKSIVRDATDKFVGFKYDYTKDFKPQSKKST